MRLTRICSSGRVDRVLTRRVTVLHRLQLSMPEDQRGLLARGWLLCTQIVSQIVNKSFVITP